MRLGAPVHYSTMHFIEAMQRILKAAWKRTSRRLDASAQVMRRISVLRWIHSRLRPSLDIGLGAVAALLPDKPTQAHLTGVLSVRPGVNSPYMQPNDDVATAWNVALDKALQDLRHSLIPEQHIIQSSRVYPRRAGTFVRQANAQSVLLPSLSAVMRTWLGVL